MISQHTSALISLMFFLFSVPNASSDAKGGCGCNNTAPATAPAPAPTLFPTSELQPSDFPNLKQYNAYKVIQRFRQSITCDPNNVTANWVGSRPCTYQGFFCESPPYLTNTPTIASIDFNGFRLCAPTLAGFLDQLPDLALFHANSNNFSDTVPILTSLPFLYELDISNNIHFGPFPSAALPLNQLTFLDLRFNLFSGTVPPFAFSFSRSVLFLNNNHFSQPIPEDIGSSTASFLTLANNGFTGPIPRSIGNAFRTLVEVLLLNNRLCGCLPSEIGMLKLATVFDAGFNQITGLIPNSFGCLLKLEQLNLAGNQLYGEVPDVVCRLAEVGNLANLSLSENYFTSVGYSCWGLIKSGVLDVRRNCIVGFPEQRSAAECVWFLAHRKFCPWHTYIPCHLSYLGRNGTVADAGVSLSPPPPRSAPATGYKTYSALHHPNDN